MIRVTADSNIYISALHFGGPPDGFLDFAHAGRDYVPVAGTCSSAIAVGKVKWKVAPRPSFRLAHN